jgi:hypothetical protein
MIRSRENLLGARVFLVGLILAVVVGLFSGNNFFALYNPLILGIMAVLGIVVGYFVAEKDVQTFLLASVALVIVSYAGISGLVLGAAISGLGIGKMISSVLQTLLALFVPATIIVAIKTVFSISKS